MAEIAFTFENVESDIEAGFPRSRVIEAINWVFDQHQVADYATVSVVVTDDQTVRALNRQFRNVDSATDILSFPAEPPPIDPEFDSPDFVDDDVLSHVGDLIIAYPYTAHQAADAGHALADELALLALHGALHLLNYDHDTAENEHAMWTVQADGLDALHIPIAVPRFHEQSEEQTDHDSN